MELETIITLINTAIIAPIWVVLGHLRSDIKEIRAIAIQAQIEANKGKKP